MFRTIADFHRYWDYEAKATQKLFSHMTEESLFQRVSEDGRTLGFIAWHIVTTISEMFGQAGLPIEAPKDKEIVPRNVPEFVSAHESAARSLGKIIDENWTDGELEDEIPMYGEKWKKGNVLYALIAHEAHHRGQMTVLMRQAGLKVPGIYGPAKEEWEAYGMPAME